MGWLSRILFSILVAAGVMTWLLMDRSDSRYEDSILALESLLAQRERIFQPDVPIGEVHLPALQRAEIKVPPVFTKDGQLKSVWNGRLQIVKATDALLIVDFYDVPPRACHAILRSSEKFPGITRIAASSKAADERAPPVPEADIDILCRNAAPLVRVVAAP